MPRRIASTTRIISSRGHATAVAIAVLSTFAWVGSVAAQEQAPDKLRVIGGGLPLRVARMNGLLAKYRLEVEASSMSSSDTMRADLVAGKIDIANANVDNAIAAAETGADIIIVVGASGAQEELIAQPGNKTLLDLRGKLLLVDAPNTAQAIKMKKILLLKGLKPNVDYQMKPGAVTDQRLVAMRENKDYAATMLYAPASILAKHAGFVSLGSVTGDLGNFQGGGGFVQRGWAQQHSDVLERYLAAQIEAQRWIMAPANKQKIIDMMIKDQKLSSDVAAETYETQMAPGGLQKDMQLDVAGLENVLKLRAEIEGSWNGKAPDARKYYDPSYYQRALALLK